MTLEEQNIAIEELFKNCVAILHSKGRDYNPDNESLKGVRDVAREAGITPQQVLWVYLRKHISAVHQYTKTGNVSSEGIVSRLMDVINYAALMYVLFVQDSGTHVSPRA